MCSVLVALHIQFFWPFSGENYGKTLAASAISGNAAKSPDLP
jgi:hypothetical protein